MTGIQGKINDGLANTYTKERIETVLVVETFLRRFGKVPLKADLDRWSERVDSGEENGHVTIPEQRKKRVRACDIGWVGNTHHNDLCEWERQD